MPSFPPFIFPSVLVDWDIPERKLTPNWVGYVGRPLGDVPACCPVSICFIITFDVFEVAIVPPVLFAYVSTSWAGLACLVWLSFFDSHAFSFCNMLQGMPKEPVGNAVNLPCALLAPFAFTLPEVSEFLDGNISVETLSKLNNFVSYLPNSCPNIVSLFSAEPLQFKPSLTFGKGVSIFLELCSSFLEAKPLSGNIFSEISLLQNLAFCQL